MDQQRSRVGRVATWTLVLWLLGVLVATLAGCGGDRAASSAAGTATTTPGTTSPDGRGGEVLASISAEGGQWGDPGADGSRTLALRRADAETVWFAERPSRRAGVVPTATVVDRWADVFKGDPPNAVLVEHDAAGEQVSTVVTLTDPTYRPDTGTLEFRAVLIRDEDRATSLAKIGGPRRADLPAAFGAASLFIDAIYDNPFEYIAEHDSNRWPPPP